MLSSLMSFFKQTKSSSATASVNSKRSAPKNHSTQVKNGKNNTSQTPKPSAKNTTIVPIAAQKAAVAKREITQNFPDNNVAKIPATAKIVTKTPQNPLVVQGRAQNNGQEASGQNGGNHQASQNEYRRRLVADESKIQELMYYTGQVLTIDGGILNATPRQRLVTAFLSDGTLLVHKDNPINPEVSEIKEAIKRTRYQIKQEYHVDLEVIRKIHESAERRDGGRRLNSRDGETLQKMQHEVLNLIQDAADNHCSDIHINVGRYEAVIRMRKDNVMMKMREVKADWASDLCASAFNMADASDSSYRPLEYQGARISNIRTPLPEGVQSIRLQFNPLPNGGRYMVARLLYANSVSDSLTSVIEDVDTLGYSGIHIEQIRRMRRKPFGINVISGPTGSGKSTTLQRTLMSSMKEKRQQVNVITIEDPPEYIIAGASQLPVLNATTDEDRSEKFRSAITASLRSDPDIIMIGEIRDAPSSKLAFQAAMSGHQVWTSLHTNDAISILDRLRDLQVETYKLSDHTLITGLIGQRLIRRLCNKCKISFDRAISSNIVSTPLVKNIERLGKISKIQNIFFANEDEHSGCSCHAGYIGREVVAETICPNLSFMQFIRDGDKNRAYEYWLDELNGITMLEHAIQKMMNGRCDPRDVEDKAGELRDLTDERAKIAFEKIILD